MEKLELYNEPVELRDYLIRIGDLSYIDGPLLSLFQDLRNKNLYLFDWVDSDSNSNRWLIYRVNPFVLNRFLSKEFSHREMFLESLKKYPCYFADINSKSLSNYSIYRIKFIPETYYPLDIYFDQKDAKGLTKIILVLNNILQESINDIDENKVEPIFSPVDLEIGSIKTETFNSEYFRIQRNLQSGFAEIVATSHPPVNQIPKLYIKLHRQNAIKTNRISSRERVEVFGR